VFVLRSWLVWRRTGVYHVALGRSDSVHDFIGALMRVTIASVAVVVAVFALAPGLYAHLAPIGWLVRPTVRLAGCALLMLALIWTTWAQAAMGTSWRIGIDFERTTEPVRAGPFRWSRNPIFLGLLVTLGGLFLVLPNAVTLAILGVGAVLILVQVRLEEAHLLEKHGQAYRVYCSEVRHWL
jgi:protein-S-isoprenylcysteine O-methyltransferase Ste14